MTHTVDTLMVLADAYADAECSDYLTGEASSLWYRENLRKALTETLQKRDESIDYLTRQCEKYAGQAAQGSANFHILSITTAYEQGVGKGHQTFLGRKTLNPYKAPSDYAKAWDYGYEEGQVQASRLGDKT